MLPTSRGQFPLHPISFPQEDFPSSHDATDPSDLYSRDLGRHAFSWRCGEQQFVILPAVKRNAEIDFPG
jgi:hypothetical protein